MEIFVGNEFLLFNIFKLRTHPNVNSPEYLPLSYLRVRSLYHVTVDSDYKSSVSFIHWIIKIFDFYNKLCSHCLINLLIN
jgi:hypothetical protein